MAHAVSSKFKEHISDSSMDGMPDDFHFKEELDESEERQGLLSGRTDTPTRESGGYPAQKSDNSTWSWRKMVAVGAAIISLLFASYSGAIYYMRYKTVERAKAMHFDGQTVRSNGTHDFKRTVLIVSIDGLRADYLERGLTPHLLDISRQGVRAKYMRPIFPTLTFPNHWALMTGLYAESHGIVANNFWDAETDTEFHYNREESSWNPHWWYGEPMWETANKAGVINANLMWPGPPKTMSGASPTHFLPWKDKVPLREKHDQIMTWIDMPFADRPQLIMAYEPSLDQAGHLTGPYSKLVNDTLGYVDGFAKDLHDSLVARNLTEIVDVVFVSDHGMTDTSHPELVYMDEILGEEGWSQVGHEDGWPSMGLHFKPGANVTKYFDILLDAAAENSDKFDVYTPETMPERYHFAHCARIAPVYIVPKMGYVLTTRKEGDVGLSKGNHGYDNNDPSMRAMFVAHGPFTAVAKALHQARSPSSWLSSSSLVSRALGRPNKGWNHIGDDTYVMDPFQNVEIYGLVMKLLGIEKWAAHNNGTEGFWDPYF